MDDDDQHGDVRVRLLRAGEGAAALAIAAEAGVPGSSKGRALEDALDQTGGRVEIPEVPGGAGWCFGATVDTRLVGILYACSPVDFILSHTREQGDYLTRSLVEIEVFAVEARVRGRGVGTMLLHGAEQHLIDLGVRIVVAKVDAEDMPVMRWYRHRGYTIARVGESCAIDTPAGATGINAGPSHGRLWRLAIKAPGRSVIRDMSGLRFGPR